MARRKSIVQPIVTPDRRYIVVKGRLWRTTKPSLSGARRAALTKELMAARRAVAKALKTRDGLLLKRARAAVNSAKVHLGERGRVWWSDGAPDYNRYIAKNTPYAAWYARRTKGQADAFMTGMKEARKVVVNDRMQRNYIYFLTEPMGKNFHAAFRPELTPKQMLALGVFGGKYLTDGTDEFPADWFVRAKLNHERHLPELNFFGVNASRPLSEWKENGWADAEDPRGWFQWYCRYYMGRRSPDDERQIKRWKGMKRHIAQIKANCAKADLNCRRKQRQALLHWAYDSRKL